MRRISWMALLLLCLTLLLACNKPTDDPKVTPGTQPTDPLDEATITFGENGVLTTQVNTKSSGTIKVPSPAGTHAQYCVGWYSKSVAETVFLPVGATYEYQAGETKSFTPLYLHFTTGSTPTFDTTVAGGGIGFSTDILKSDWQKLTAVTTKVSCGTLVCSTADLLTVDGKLTHAALAASQLTAFDLASDAWQAESDRQLTFGAIFSSITPENRTTPYTAVGYVKITYSNGTEAYVYANYGEKGAPVTSLLAFSEAVKQHLHFTTNHMALLDLTARGGGIEYISTIQKDEWNILSLTAESITCGTLIYPTADLEMIGGTLTHAALESAGQVATDILSSSWQTNTEATLTFAATLTGIPAYHRWIAYTAVGYIKITYTDGIQSYIYATYESDTAPSHSVLSLATAAKNDLSAVETDVYKYAVDDLFSPYTDAERNTISELSKLSVGMLVNQTTSPGKYLLDPNYASMFTSRLVRDNDASCAAEWAELYQAIGNTHYDDGGAIVITANDGTPLSADLISKVTMRNGTIEVNWTKYIFYNGALVVPYSVYTSNY